jgi:hypothetical protein
MGMLRTTIVLGAILFALPSPPEDPAMRTSAPGPGTLGYVAAATEAFSDVKDFCARRPFVCQTAGHLAAAVERKAKYSAKLIYEWANDATSKSAQSPFPPDLAATDKIQTGSTASANSAMRDIPLGLFLLPDGPGA